MSVEFEGEATLPSRVSAPTKAPVLVRLLLSTGLVKTQGQANVLLILIAIVTFVIAGFLLVDTNSVAPTPDPTQYRVWPT